jgi:hypothetical protein
MKYLVTLFLFAALPFFCPSTGSRSAFSFSTLRAQEELIEEPEEQPKGSKEEPKKEVQQNQEENGNGELKEDYKEEVPESKRYFKERYEETFNAPFETVWNAVKKSLDGLSCMVAQQKYSQTDEGLYKGTIKSDFCVLTLGDTTFKVMKKYSMDFPLIPGGVWLNGRIQHTYIVKETADHKVNLLLRSELSGFEDFVTHEVHFWKSNGMLETRMLESIRKNLASTSGN